MTDEEIKSIIEDFEMNGPGRHDDMIALARVLMARVRSEAVEEAMRGGFLTCVSGDGKPFVKVEFHELEQAQQLHALLALAPPRSQDERKG
jgi:hypothetical protein